MASSVSSKLPISRNVIYDSVNDTTIGRKRAVQTSGGGVSVAERARLFGTQVTYSSTTKIPQPTQSNFIRQDGNYQPLKKDIDPPQKQNSSYSTSQRVLNHHQSPVRTNNRPYREQLPTTDLHDYSRQSPVRTNNRPHREQLSSTDLHDYSQRSPARTNNRPHREQPSAADLHDYSQRSPARTNNRPHREQPSSADLRDYSTLTRSHNHHRHSSRHQRPISTYDSPPKQSSSKAYYPHITPSNYEFYDRQKPLPRNNTYQPSNYFQPIQDPLQVLMNNSTQVYTQPQKSATIGSNINGLQPFNLANLISNIQQDYLNNISPYVSSVQFIGNDQSLADIGFIAPPTTRTDYMRRPNDMYHRPTPMQQYDVIDTNNFYRYEKRQPTRSYHTNQYSSVQRRRHRSRYHDQGSSPIHILESSNKTHTQSQSQKPPANHTVATKPIEEVEDEVIENDKEKEASETSEESSESEEEAPAQPANKPAPAPVTTAPLATPRNEVTRPPLPPLKAAEPSETEDSESEESESDSETESDDEDEKPKLPPVPRPSNTRSAPPTPLANARAAPQRAAPSTPQTNVRVVSQRAVPINTTNDPPESSKSIKSFDLTASQKSPSIGSRLKSMKNKFRRKKSE